MKINRKYSRGFLIAASAYRKQSKERPMLDFSESALDEQYNHETYGTHTPDPKVNGYTCGKWILDATLKQMYEDHQAGLITKYELLRESSVFVRREIKKWFATPYYGFTH